MRRPFERGEPNGRANQDAGNDIAEIVQPEDHTRCRHTKGAKNESNEQRRIIESQ